MLLKYVIPIVVLLATATTTRSFTIAPSQQSFGPIQTAKWHLPNSNRHQRTTNTAIYSSAPDQEQEATETEVPISSMRVKEIQAALKELNVDSSDCFDKESLVKRLQEARENPPVVNMKSTPAEKDDNSSDETSTSSSDTTTASESSSSSSDTSTATPKTTTKTDFDKDAKLVELRAMRVRELREACAKRQIRWGQFIEKEDLVQALIASMEASADFSLSGSMTAGEVTDLTGEQLEQELSQRSEAPLLLDIYATWCVLVVISFLILLGCLCAFVLFNFCVLTKVLFVLSCLVLFIHRCGPCQSTYTILFWYCCFV